MQILSIVVLKEAFVENQKERNEEGKLFEESIVLYKNKGEINIDDRKEFFKFVKKNLDSQEDDYYNAFEELVKWRTVKILDVFELNDEINSIPKFVEVYSRYLPMETDSIVDDVLEKYYPDGVFY